MTAIMPDGQISCLSFRKRNYYGQAADLYTNRSKELKGPDISYLERGDVPNSPENLGKIFDYYHQTEVIKAQDDCTSRMDQWFKESLSIALFACGADGHSHANKLSEHGKNFVFVFVWDSWDFALTL